MIEPDQFKNSEAVSSEEENFERALRPKELVLEPFASAVATLDEDELREGVALVDIGGGTTDVAIFLDNIIRTMATNFSNIFLCIGFWCFKNRN